MTSLPALREKFARTKVLEVAPSQSPDSETGYQNAWLRDNAMVAYSKWVRGDAESALRTAQGLGKFLLTQIGVAPARLFPWVLLVVSGASEGPEDWASTSGE